MIYFKTQHLHSSRKLPSYVFVPNQREDNYDEAMYLFTIFCVVFQLGTILATSDRKSY